MKRMLSAVAVVAIVSSALAFAPAKGGSFCASLNQNDGCQVINGKTELVTTHGSNTYFKYNAWNGQTATCLSTRCETQTILYNEQ